jgi:hypothetical protein
MAAIDKLVARTRNNRKTVRYDDLVRVLMAADWREVTGGTGSHQRFDAPDGSIFMTVVRPHGGDQYVNPRAVSRALTAWDAAQRRKAEDDEGRHG